VMTGVVERVDEAGLTVMRVGEAEFVVDEPATLGQRIQIQVLARDVIVAASRPSGLSVRNVVSARVVSVTPDVGRAVLVELDVGRSATLLARITSRASQELELSADMQVWVLIKAVSLRGHVFSAPAR
jgi:molybdate transport system ATP-binding protein